MITELIIGANGQIGTSLANYFDSHGIDYLKTTRRPKLDSKEIYLNLSEFENNVQIPTTIKNAYFLEGISDIQYCENNKEYVSQINVEKTLEVIRFLNNHDVHTVFVSSASVFDGGSRSYSADGDKNPRNFYGTCKSRVEDSILSESLNVSILRAGKIIDELPILKRWSNQLGIGETPIVYSSRNISPLSNQIFSEKLAALGLHAFGGISQISACDEISYLELFKRCFPGQPMFEVCEKSSHELLEPGGLFAGFSPPMSWDAINQFR